MFANIFSFRNKPTIQDERIAGLKADIATHLEKNNELTIRFAKMEDQNILLEQRLQELEDENTKFGNALSEITQQETDKPNATVKRIVTIAKVALGVTP